MIGELRTPEEILADLGLTLPERFPPAGAYLACRRSGDLLYVSGHGPMRDGKVVYAGKVGRDLDVPTAQAAAELTMLNALSSMKAEIGELRWIRGFVKLLVMVNAAESFVEPHRVAEGASLLLHKVFGERAAHARSAVGMAALPLNIAVEIELIAEVG